MERLGRAGIRWDQIGAEGKSNDADESGRDYDWPKEEKS